MRTVRDVYFESLPFSLSFSLTQIRGESKDARDLANRASLSESMMRVAHNCERAEFARLRREDSKKMKQMRDEILLENHESRDERREDDDDNDGKRRKGCSGTTLLRRRLEHRSRRRRRRRVRTCD